MKNNLFLILVVLVLTSCANRTSSNQINQDGFGDSLAVADESGNFVEEEPLDMAASLNQESSEEVKLEGSINPDDQDSLAKSGANVENAAPENSALITDEMADYKVDSGDSLMWIAFKIYGDYAKWKILKDLNPKFRSSKSTTNEVIKYYVPAQKFVWAPKGLPHVIKLRDTLGSISKEKYGTGNNWKHIYDNNQPMIKDPNLIFAGFTLYYIKDVRELASK